MRTALFAWSISAVALLSFPVVGQIKVDAKLTGCGQNRRANVEMPAFAGRCEDHQCFVSHGISALILKATIAFGAGRERPTASKNAPESSFAHPRLAAIQCDSEICKEFWERNSHECV